MRRRTSVSGPMLVWAVACLLTGCGRIGFDVGGQPADAGVPDAGAMDASPADAAVGDAAAGDAAAGDAATPCTTWGPFGTPTVVAGLDTSITDWSPSLSVDELTVFLHVYDGVGDLYTATRPDVMSPFSAPTPLTALNTTSNEGSPSLSPDGLTLFFSSDRPGGTGQTDIYSVTRPDTTSAWGTPAPVTAANSPWDEGDTWLSYDGLRLYFTSAAVTSYDIYMVSRPDTSSPFGNKVSFPELDSPQNDYTLCLSRDELEIFISSIRPGGMGGEDLYVAHRPTVDSPFDTPVPVTELNTPYDDRDPWLSADGKRLYMNRDSLTAGGRPTDVWMATRSCMP